MTDVRSADDAPRAASACRRLHALAAIAVLTERSDRRVRMRAHERTAPSVRSSRARSTTSRRATSTRASAPSTTLARMGPAALPALAHALESPSPDVREAATRALIGIGTPAIALLGQAAADRRSVVRDPATQALQTFGAPARARVRSRAVRAPITTCARTPPGPSAGSARRPFPRSRERSPIPIGVCGAGRSRRWGASAPRPSPCCAASTPRGDSGLQEDVEHTLDRLQSGGGDSPA